MASPSNLPIRKILFGGQVAPSKISPRRQDDLPSRMVSQLVFEKLIDLDASLRVTPQIAERWEFDSEGSILRFYIRKDRKFSDGSEVTSNEVSNSISQVCRASRYGNSDLEEIIECGGGSAKVRAEDRYVVSLRIRVSSELALRYLAAAGIQIFKRSKRLDIGSGPMILNLPRSRPGYLEFDPNVHFLGRSAEGLTDKIKLACVSVPYDKLEKKINSPDVVAAILFDRFSFRDGIVPKNFGLLREFPDSTLALTVNSKWPGLTTKESRRRFVESFVDRLVASNCTTEDERAEWFIPPGVVGHSRGNFEVKGPAARREEVQTSKRARSRTAGLVMIKAAEDECIQTAYLAALPKEAGRPAVRIFKSYDALDRTVARGEFAAYLEYFVFKSREPINSLRYFSTGKHNYSKLSPNNEFEKILNKARNSETLSERAKYYAAATSWLQEEALVVPISHHERWHVFRSDAGFILDDAAQVNPLAVLVRWLSSLKESKNEK